jgi:riboflavin synthase
MFTGIIEGLGTIQAVHPAGGGRRLTVSSDFPLTGARIGDSIAVNGACLTPVSLDTHRFTVDVSPETVRRTSFTGIRVGERVNLERALRLSDRLDGHLVSGHIDGTGRIRERRTESNALWIVVDIPPELGRYLIPKGSVAVDGVSLTVNRCAMDRLEVSIIPHTAGMTTVGFKRTGEPVNIETDLIGKYVERFLTVPKPEGAADEAPAGGIDRDLLARFGFLSR